MSGLRWPLAAILLIAVAAVAAPRFWPSDEQPIGTESPIAARHYREGSAELRRISHACSISRSWITASAMGSPAQSSGTVRNLVRSWRATSRRMISLGG